MTFLENNIQDILLVGLLSLLTLISLFAIFTRNLVTSTLLLSVFSLVMALLYLVLQAPDVSITEAAVGGGISTLLFIAAISLVGEYEEKVKFNYEYIIGLIVVGLFIGFMAYTSTFLPEFGTSAGVVNEHLANSFLTNSYNDIGIPNVVTSVLASYRGFDTLGEVFVIFTAGLSIWILLKRD